MRSRVVAVAVFCLVALSGPTFAQGLAEIARATEAARQANTGRPPAKVYTNKDLPAVDRPAPETDATRDPAANDPAPASEPPPAATSPSDSTPPERGEQYWRDRMRPLRDRLARTRALAEDTRQRADAMTRAAERCFGVGVVCAEYVEALRLLDQHKVLLAELAREEQAVFALQEEARRAGVPPGWLRQ